MRFSMIGMGLAAVAMVACGGSEDGGKPGGGSTPAPGKVESTIPASMPAGAITDAQAEDFCKSVAAAAESTFGSEQATGALCGFSAYALSALAGDDPAATCKAVYDACVKEPAETMTGECKKPSAACTATVGALEACFNDSMAEFSQLLSSLPSCDDVGKAAEDPMTEASSPASCKVVEEKCPEALDDIPDPSAMFGG